MTRSARLRVALAGAGLAGRSHAFDLATHQKLELAGVVRTGTGAAENLTRDFGGKVYASLAEVLTDDTVRAVVVAVPPAVALGVAEATARAGRPCLVEKPVAVSLPERERLRRLASARPPVVAPYNRRYLAHVRQAADLIATGGIGEIVEVTGCWTGPYRSRFATGSGTYRALAGPRRGMLVDVGVHAIDAVVFLIGSAASLSVERATLVTNERGADIQGSVLLSAGSAPVRLTFVDEPEPDACGTWHLDVRGSTGHLALDATGCLYRDGRRDDRRFVPASELSRPVDDLVGLLRGEPPLGAVLGDALRHSDLVTAAYDAAEAARCDWIRPRAKALGRLNGSC